MIDPEIIFEFQSQPEQSEEEKPIFNWVAPEDLPYCDGHFPQNPILPAVAILDGTLEALKLIQKDGTLSFERIQSGKFLNSITPGTPVQIHLTRIQGEEWEAEWRSRSQDGGKIFAHLKLSLR